jgi:Holliday junction resolvase RusA-like endonuclease
MEVVALAQSVEFEVVGTAAPQGSRQPHVPTYKDGTPVRRHTASCPGSRSRADAAKFAHLPCRCPIMATHVEDDFGERHKTWRTTVQDRARVAMSDRPLLDCLLRARFTFYRRRPLGHYGTGRNADVLKDGAPAAPGSRPDVLKLARSIEDALTNFVYLDDSLITDEVIVKRYAGRGEPERVVVSIEPLEAQTVGDMVAHGLIEMPQPEFEQLRIDAA